MCCKEIYSPHTCFFICWHYMLWMSIDLMKENGFIVGKNKSRRDPAQTLMDVDCTNDITLLVNSPAQAESLVHNLEWIAGGIGLHVNTDKTEYMCFNQRGVISTLNGGLLKLVDKFTDIGSSVSSTENDINMQLVKAWTTIDRLSVIWKSDVSERIKCNFLSCSHINTAIWMHHVDTN